MAWVAAAKATASRAAAGITTRLNMKPAEVFLEGLFLLFLLALGFRMLDWIATRSAYADQALPLPKRPTRLREWGTGAALGWGLCLAVALPVLLSGNLHAHLMLSAANLTGVIIALATLLVIVLVEEVIFRGYPFQRLSAALGQTLASLFLSVGFAVTLISNTSRPHHLFFALLDGTLFGLMLTMAWLRTHGLWLGWGLHFAYRAVMAVVLGLPIAGHGAYGSLADGYATGPRWLSGGAFGLDATLIASVMLTGGLFVLYRVTRDWAWLYTHQPIVAGGYEVSVAPPAAHAAMEKAAAPPPLVQIAATTPQSQTLPELPREDMSLR